MRVGVECRGGGRGGGWSSESTTQVGGALQVTREHEDKHFVWSSYLKSTSALCVTVRCY